MKVYIASSWRNQHGVMMLTNILRKENDTVISWIENNFGEFNPGMPFDMWIESERGLSSFEFDTKGATQADIFVYYGPAGSDAAAELGAAWASNVRCVGLVAKGDSLGLMRLMCESWHYDIDSLLQKLATIRSQLDNQLGDEKSF